MASYLTQTNDLDRYYTTAARDHTSGTYLRAQVAPPPPLRSAAARGRQQTLGPVFNEEEDGDDSEYVARRMAQMQLGQGSYRDSDPAMARMNHTQHQQQSLQMQQQYLLQQLLSQTGANRLQPTREMQDAVRMQQYHQMQQIQLAQMQDQLRQQVDPRIQAQLLAQLQATSGNPAGGEARSLRSAAQAQLQAQVQARAKAEANARAVQAEAEAYEQATIDARREQAKVDTKKVSAAKFASTTSRKETSALDAAQALDEVSPVKPATLGRFAQARLQSTATPFGELTALLARRSAETYKQPSIQSEQTTIPTSTITTSQTAAPQSDDRQAARQALSTLGHGRPSTTTAATQNRAKSNPFPVSPVPKTESNPARTVSMAQPLKPIRQPFGPPGPTNELGEKNFAAMARKKAGKGLGMLGRRGEVGSGENSPVIA